MVEAKSDCELKRKKRPKERGTLTLEEIQKATKLAKGREIEHNSVKLAMRYVIRHAMKGMRKDVAADIIICMCYAWNNFGAVAEYARNLKQSLLNDDPPTEI